MDHSRATRLASQLLAESWANDNHGTVVKHLLELTVTDALIMGLVLRDHLDLSDCSRLISRLTWQNQTPPGAQLGALARIQAESKD